MHSFADLSKKGLSPGQTGFPEFATYLLTSMRNTTVGEDVRQMAAVLLRRVISNEFEDFYNKVQKNII